MDLNLLNNQKYALIKREENGNLADTLFGFLRTNVNYVWTEGILNDYHNLRWKINPRQQYLSITYQTKALRFNKDCLMKYFIISTAYPMYSCNYIASQGTTTLFYRFFQLRALQQSNY